MPAKKHKPEEIIGKLREVQIVLGQGETTVDACRRIAVSEQIRPIEPQRRTWCLPPDRPPPR